jgi:alcohol dehydrogenase (cytochrome c)
MIAALLALLAQAAPLPQARGVPFASLRDAAATPEQWLTYSGSYAAQRHSPLAEIHTGNVARLRPVWVYQSHEAGKLETSPLAIDGVLYLSEKPHIATALDGRTGRPLWSTRRPAAVGVPTCCGPVNRGLAVLDDALFMGTLDGHLLALDMRTGKVRWDVQVSDGKTGASITMAPLALRDKVVVGVGGGEFGVRGFLDAYQATTGKRAWRFWTVAGPGDPGRPSWPGDTWKTGGATTWVTGAYDPALNLLYWGTGNPAPDYDGDQRQGDNLYSDCLVALDADTGARRWHFQFTPHDLHDWDSSQVPVLFDAPFRGQPRKLVAQANRNAFYYVLDRVTGEFLLGVPYVKQTWASGLDARGRPLVLPGTAPTDKGVVVYPGLSGGTNWFSPAYDPQTGLFYVQAHEGFAQTFFKRRSPFKPGGHFEGGVTRDMEGVEHHGVVKAIEAVTGKVAWEFPLHSPPSGGVLSTAGGLVWSGNREGTFFALDARSGRPLWRFQTGGGISAAAVSFAVDGKQHVAIAAGQALFVFAL